MAESDNGGNAPGFEPAVTTEVVVNPAGTEGAEPKAPEAGAPNASGTEQQPAVQPAVSTPEEGAGSQGEADPEKGETPSTEPDQFKEIIEGWKEDRTLLATTENENRTLRDENAQLKNKLARYEGEDDGDVDEYEGLTREQREAKIVEKHQQAETEKAEKLRQEVAKEISFHERTDPEFRANKVAVLKVAEAFKATSIEQAMKIWKAQQGVASRAKTAAATETARKQNAGATPGGADGGKPASKGYDPAVEGKMSIREIYAQGGIS